VQRAVVLVQWTVVLVQRAVVLVQRAVVHVQRAVVLVQRAVVHVQRTVVLVQTVWPCLEVVQLVQVQVQIVCLLASG
jgi:hypothetical protein